MHIQSLTRFLCVGLVTMAAATAGCAADTSSDGDSDSSVAEESSSAYTSGIGLKLGGDYVSADTLSYPRLSLDAKKQTYAWDTGIRCVRAPCPSFETGRWSAYRSISTGRYYVGLVSTARKRHWFSVDFASDGAVKGLVGVWGTTEKFVPARVAVVGCEAMLCAEGSFCAEDDAGQGSCLAYPTCKTAKCAAGSYCADRPIMCFTTPCAPTAPSCEACPAPGTTINCMPGPGSRPPACAAHESVTATCPGVTIAF